ncbi:MAG: four helix bundle protein [Dehalococcoidia bacterium]
MDQTEFQRRTKGLALSCIQLVRELQRDIATDAVARQLVRSASSVGASYRAACRARSTADMIAKLHIVEEEADETGYWLELLVQSGSVDKTRVLDIHREANEILAITIASINTLRRRQLHKP